LHKAVRRLAPRITAPWFSDLLLEKPISHSGTAICAGRADDPGQAADSIKAPFGAANGLR
jgi:hypothetical protein